MKKITIIVLSVLLGVTLLGCKENAKTSIENNNVKETETALVKENILNSTETATLEETNKEELVENNLQEENKNEPKEEHKEMKLYAEKLLDTSWLSLESLEKTEFYVIDTNNDGINEVFLNCILKNGGGILKLLYYNPEEETVKIYDVEINNIFFSNYTLGINLEEGSFYTTNFSSRMIYSGKKVQIIDNEPVEISKWYDNGARGDDTKYYKINDTDVTKDEYKSFLESIGIIYSEGEESGSEKLSIKNPINFVDNTISNIDLYFGTNIAEERRLEEEKINEIKSIIEQQDSNYLNENNGHIGYIGKDEYYDLLEKFFDLDDEYYVYVLNDKRDECQFGQYYYGKNTNKIYLVTAQGAMCYEIKDNQRIKEYKNKDYMSSY